MPFARNLSIIAVSVSALLAGAATAFAQEDVALSLELAGEAFEGAPAFAVFFNGRQIGAGAVSSAIDTQTDGRLSAASDYTGYVETFDFEIPADTFSDEGAIEVRFTNDAAGENGDRNLFILSATLAGKTVPFDAFVVEREGVVGNTVVSGRPMVALYKTSDIAFAAAPEDGWSVTPDGGAPQADDTPAAVEPVCDTAREIALVGFARNSAALTAEHRGALDALIESVDAQACELTLTGYSSASGPASWNRELATMRAEAVRAYFEGQGVAFGSANVETGGETQMFGTANADNQRVVVVVGAPAD
ncbi:OmpA family protein [Pelagibacterium xiamenense]|uniref:OmpA family protein n=1 Tax=Pelagibacterium xiamenense TaxID=2901140 RepID=UPI001E45FE20|nr:OmpA family protein [Pelagibacterium xiamenense]MCD7059665.1 OmpA family protein [Pelagibacterium xiamenense]